MADALEGTAEFALIEEIAAALRAELGPAMEDQPGGPDPSTAGQVNRAFRVVVRTVLARTAPPDADLADLVNVMLDRLARRRLEADGLTKGEIEQLIVYEAKGRDDWLTFLLLTSRDEIELLLQSNDPDDNPPPA